MDCDRKQSRIERITVDIANISDRNLQSQVLQVVTPRSLVFGPILAAPGNPH
jgi:hypothetical protein